ncbi:hypothetical protein D3C79_1114040 [compost metagenome]
MVKAASLHAIEITDQGCESGVALAYHQRDSALIAAFIEHFRSAFSGDHLGKGGNDARQSSVTNM